MHVWKLVVWINTDWPCVCRMHITRAQIIIFRNHSGTGMNPHYRYKFSLYLMHNKFHVQHTNQSVNSVHNYHCLFCDLNVNNIQKCAVRRMYNYWWHIQLTLVFYNNDVTICYVVSNITTWYTWRTNVMQLGSMFISNCNNTLHVSDAFCVHPQEHLKL